MDKNGYLKLIMLFSVFGMLFSGYLSFGELFPGAPSGFACATTSTKIFGLPTCVYGLFMYMVTGVLAYLAYKSKK